MSKPDDYLWDGSGPADREVQRLEQLLAPLAHDRPLDELRLRRKRSRVPWIIAGAVALAAAAALVLYLRTSPHGPCSGGAGLAFTASGGTVACGDGTVANGVLPVGGVLDTGTATAKLTMPDVGTAELFANTRVRLDRSDPQHQNFHLERGGMHAKVNAPPRLFSVTTPGTSVVDLGCEYTIQIDDKGRGSIEVQSGQVELETTAHAVIVAPAGTTARLLEGRSPSVPVAVGASAELRAAVLDHERGVAGSLERVLQLAGSGDAITLANLVVILPGDPTDQVACRAPCVERELVLKRLAELAPPPEGVTVQAALADPAVLQRWRDEVVVDHLALHEEQNSENHLQKR
jgi:FecR-like protein